MVRALDITDEPDVAEPETVPEEEFNPNLIANTLHNNLLAVDPPVDSEAGYRESVNFCLNELAGQIDVLRAENHELRQRLAGSRSLVEFIHQNPTYTAFRGVVEHDDRQGNPPQRLYMMMVERLDRMAGTEFEPGRKVSRSICLMCGEVADRNCGRCNSEQRINQWVERFLPVNVNKGRR